MKGEGFAVDASVLEANASRYHGKPPEELDWSDKQRQRCAVGACDGQCPSSSPNADVRAAPKGEPSATDLRCGNKVPSFRYLRSVSQSQLSALRGEQRIALGYGSRGHLRAVVKQRIG